MYHRFIEVHKEVSVLVNFAWLTRPERLSAKDEVKRPKGLQLEVRAPRAPKLLVKYKCIYAGV